jgi:hypothetical protein
LENWTHLVGAVDLHVGLPDAFNWWHQHLGTVSLSAALVGRALQRCMLTIRRRGNLQALAEQFDPIDEIAPLYRRLPDCKD